MPYISTEEVKQIRKNLKKELPEYKFSVRKDDSSGVFVAILKGPLEIVGLYVNTFHYESHYGPNSDDPRPEFVALIDKIVAVIKDVKPQTELVYDGDYGSVPNFYYDISVGSYGKPYEQVAA